MKAFKMHRDCPPGSLLKTGGARVKAKQDSRNKRPGMSAEHCAQIRDLPCAACHSAPAGTVHHLKSQTGERGMGLRATDKWGIPLCMTHHDTIERAGTRNEGGQCAKWGFNPHDLARALWGATGMTGTMRKIVMATGGKA